MDKEKRIRGFMGKTARKLELQKPEVVGIHKHYEIINESDEVVAQADTLVELSRITGVSVRTLTNRFIKYAGGLDTCEVVEVLYPIYDDDTIYDITPTEVDRLRYFKKTGKLETLLEDYEG